jgi:hypothetical protein
MVQGNEGDGDVTLAGTTAHERNGGEGWAATRLKHRERAQLQDAVPPSCLSSETTSEATAAAMPMSHVNGRLVPHSSF